MDVYLLNGTNQVYPTMNGTNQVYPTINGMGNYYAELNGDEYEVYGEDEPLNIDPVTVTLVLQGVKAVFGIYEAWKSGKKAKAAAHSEFMRQVYAMGSNIIPKKYHQEIHRLAERDMKSAALLVEDIANKSIERIKAEETAAMSQQTTAVANNQLIKQPGRVILPGRPRSGVANWWSQRTTGEKIAIAGGGALAIAALIYYLKRKK